MNENLKSYYLQQLGIDQWVLRKNNYLLAQLQKNAVKCTTCAKNALFYGSPQATIMIIGEALDTLRGGKVEILFIHMLQSIGLKEQDVYLTTLLNCNLHNSLLSQQIDCIQPSVLIALGDVVNNFLKETRLNTHLIVIKDLPFLLKNPAAKKLAYNSLLEIKSNYETLGSEVREIDGQN